MRRTEVMLWKGSWAVGVTVSELGIQTPRPPLLSGQVQCHLYSGSITVHLRYDTSGKVRLPAWSRRSLFIPFSNWEQGSICFSLIFLAVNTRVFTTACRKNYPDICPRAHKPLMNSRRGSVLLPRAQRGPHGKQKKQGMDAVLSSL